MVIFLRGLFIVVLASMLGVTVWASLHQPLGQFMRSAAFRDPWVIATLADFGVEAWAVPDRVGIWTRDVDGSEAKIGAIGVRVRRWVTMHGLSVNLAPDLSHFGGIVPCGIAEYGVTSLEKLGIALAPEAWDRAFAARGGQFLAALED